MLLARRQGCFEALAARGPISVRALARTCDIEPGATETMVRMLEALELVDWHEGGVDSTEFTDLFLTEGGPTSDVPMLDMLATWTEHVPELLEALETGEPPGAFDITRDSPHVDVFVDAVNTYVDRVAFELIAKAPLPDVRHLIVGSMGVSFSAAILDTFDEAEVTYGCLDHLVERIPRLRREYGVDPERVVETHAHTGTPEADDWGRGSFDLVFLTRKMMLDPEERIGERFAARALEALNPGGVALFWEAFHEENGETTPALALESLFDLGANPRAHPLTRGDFRDRMRSIGYESVTFVECLGGTVSFAVARAP